jgi:RNA polymerase sigma-70 factor, ECF subfamily
MSQSPTKSRDFPRELDVWLLAACQGCQQSQSELLAVCRDYLLLVANQALPNDLRAKVGASDLVQETLVEAQRNFGRFEGSDPAQLLSWLRTILLVQLAQLKRRYRQTLKREVSRESPLGDYGQGELPAATESPSGIVMRDEARTAFERALDGMPQHYRNVIIQRNIEHRSFSEIGREMGRSADATRKLWFRAIASLQQRYGVKR